MFVLMGLFVSATNMGRDTFDVAALLLRRMRGALGIATVGRERGVRRLHRHLDRVGVGVHQGRGAGDDPARPYAGFSVGVVAGSSVLGMLIPPSILIIIFGVIANVSIGDLFTSGILPGIVLAVAFCVTISAACLPAPEIRLRRSGRRCTASTSGPLATAPAWQLAWQGSRRSCVLVGIVLGGIYGGFFTPTEAGGAGALAAFADRAAPPRADAQDLLGGGARNRPRDRRDLLSVDGGAALFADADAVGPALCGRPMAADRPD